MSAHENKVGSHLISAILSQNEGNQAAFPSSVGGFLPPAPNVEDPSICRSLWGKCAISRLADHPVRDRQAAIASSVWPTVDPPRKKYNALTPNIAGHNVLTITWCHEGPQIHWLDHSNHARFHAMGGSNPYHRISQSINSHIYTCTTKRQLRVLHTNQGALTTQPKHPSSIISHCGV